MEIEKTDHIAMFRLNDFVFVFNDNDRGRTFLLLMTMFSDGEIAEILGDINASLGGDIDEMNKGLSESSGLVVFLFEDSNLTHDLPTNTLILSPDIEW